LDRIGVNQFIVTGLEKQAFWMRSSVTGSGWFVGTRHENYGRTRNKMYCGQ